MRYNCILWRGGKCLEISPVWLGTLTFLCQTLTGNSTFGSRSPMGLGVGVFQLKAHCAPCSSEPWSVLEHVVLLLSKLFLLLYVSNFACSFLFFPFFSTIPPCECVVGSEKVGCECTALTIVRFPHVLPFHSLPCFRKTYCCLDPCVVWVMC